LTRKDVLKAAAKLIRIHGYHGTSTQMIADALGVSKSTFFHHIKSKQDMLFQILHEPMQKVYPDLQEIYSQQLSPTQKLEFAVTNHILALTESIEVVAVLLQERDCLKPPYSDILEPEREGYVRFFRLVIEDGVASGEFRSVDPKMAALAVLGMCNWLVQWYNPEGEVSAQAIAEMYADFALRFLRS
jgi:AcrR family transcriptional regulator